MRSFISILLVAVIILLAGCANAPEAPPQSLDEKYGKIAIVPARYSPETEFITFARSAGGGAVKGAGIGAGSGFAVGIEAGAYNPLAGVLIGVILLPITVPLGAIGGITAYTSEEDALRIEALLSDSIRQENMSLQIAQRVLGEAVYLPQVQRQLETNSGPEQVNTTVSYENLAAHGIDTVLEIGMLRAGFKTGGPGQDYMRLFLVAHSRLVKTSNNIVVSERDFRYDSPMQPVSSWTLRHGQPLIDAFDVGYNELSYRITSTLLEQPPYWPFRTPIKRITRKTHEGYCWLKPLKPAYQYAPRKKASFSRGMDITYPKIEFTAVDSRLPLLEWEPFPRPIDIVDENNDALNRIDRVSYDLKIWEWDGKQRGDLVYDRVQLSEPRHRVEHPLHPHRKYLWSFRARYEYEGQPMVTGWSFSSLPPTITLEYKEIAVTCTMQTIPDTHYYRFQTPAR